MTQDRDKLEHFLNNLEGEVVAIIPNVTPFPANYVDFLLIVEKLDSLKEASWATREKSAV